MTNIHACYTEAQAAAAAAAIEEDGVGIEGLHQRIKLTNSWL